MLGLLHFVLTFLLLNATCASSGCTKATSSNPPVNAVEARAKLDKGSIRLAGEFLYQLLSDKPDENSVASGTSVFIPLGQLALWATGLILDELLKLLNLENKDQIKAGFPQLIDEFESQQNIVLEVATKYYANKNYPLSTNFKNTSLEIFKAEGENIDFSLAEAAAKIINQWVEERTHGKIQNLVNKDMFNGDTRLCLVNAVYFLGNWVHQFNPNDTEVKNFTKSNGEIVPLKIMYQQNTFNYAENDDYQVLEMPYKGYNVSFLVVLPRNHTGLKSTVQSLRDPDAFINMTNSMTPQKVKVSLPKMLINTQIDLRQMLTKYGVATMFDPSSDGFRGMLEKDEPIYISAAVHKAFISVDETGTEAAAATGIIIGVTSVMTPPKIYEFIATRSFSFYIIINNPESNTKVPVFCGSFVGAQ